MDITSPEPGLKPAGSGASLFAPGTTAVRRDVLGGRVWTGRRLGPIGEAEHRRVGRARERALALVEAGSGPFADAAAARCPEVSSPAPVLPPGALAGPA
jgi:hypothetical protein